MHSKQKGNIGQFVTAAFLAKCGFSVFTEEGDLSKIDLIAEKDGKLVRFQCKALTPIQNGGVQVLMTKAGPNYRFRYSEEMFDFFAVYDLETERLHFVPSSILRTHKKSLTINDDSYLASNMNWVT